MALRNIYFDLLDASLTSVDLNDGHAPHNEYASTVKSYLVNSGYSSSKIKMKSYMTKDTFLEALAYSKIFVYKGHGSETFLPTSDDDMFGFTHFHKIPQNNGMAIADLVIFSGCNTAGSNKVYTSNSFTGQAYAKGANHVIGFTDEIGCEQSTLWLKMFFMYLKNGKTIYDSGLLADSSVEAAFPDSENLINTSVRKALGNNRATISSFS